MNRLIFALALSVAVQLTAATLPTVEGETLAGIKLSLPLALKGRTALLVIGFTKDSQKQSEAWTKRLKTDLPALDTWSIVDLEDAPRLIRPMIMKAMRSATPKPRQDHFLILTKGGKALKLATSAANNDDAYLVLLDAEGNITWQTHGPVSDAAIAPLRQRFP